MKIRVGLSITLTAVTMLTTAMLTSNTAEAGRRRQHRASNGCAQPTQQNGAVNSRWSANSVACCPTAAHAVDAHSAAPRPDGSYQFVSSPAATPLTVTISADIVVCTGKDGNCGIGGTVTVNRAATDPLVAGVYMVMNQACPACSSCASPHAGMSPAILQSSTGTKLDYAFPPIDDPGNRRIVKCSESQTACIIVCFVGGTCQTYDVAPFIPADKCPAGSTTPCQECEYAKE